MRIMKTCRSAYRYSEHIYLTAANFSADAFDRRGIAQNLRMPPCYTQSQAFSCWSASDRPNCLSHRLNCSNQLRIYNPDLPQSRGKLTTSHATPTKIKTSLANPSSAAQPEASCVHGPASIRAKTPHRHSPSCGCFPQRANRTDALGKARDRIGNPQPFCGTKKTIDFLARATI